MPTVSLERTADKVLHEAYLRKCQRRIKRFKWALRRRYKREPDIRAHHTELLALLEWSFREQGGPRVAPPMSPEHQAWIRSLPPEKAAFAFFCRMYYQQAPGVPWKLDA